MADLKELIGVLKYPSQEKISLITKAYHYAEKAHVDQKRYSGEPYFNHVVETAKILAELGMGRRTISAGLLHDVIEDAGISVQALQKEFGKEIVFLVEGVTKLGTIRYTGEDRHVESLRKFFVAMSRDIRVLVIKLADRLHNMRTLEFVPKEKQQRIAKETMEIYVPLAYRLGMRKIKREMEDLAFKHLESKKYTKTLRLLKERQLLQEKLLAKFKKTLLKALAEEEVMNVRVDTRLKSVYSVYSKLTTKNKDIEKIYDISAIRVNVDTLADCYKVLGIIHTFCRPLPGRIKDYIAFPKPNGYQSLHTTVFTTDANVVEIQIRTHEMHENAEYGFAAHMAYKQKDKNVDDPNYSWFKQFFPLPKKQNFLASYIDPERLKHIPEWIKKLVDVQSYVTIPTEFMDNLKSDFFEHRMFIFDIHGNVVDLPVASTPIDFAYEQSADLGNHLFGAKVNGKFAHIDTTLKNGDIVEIVSKKGSHPHEKWLQSCKTSLAKKYIKQALVKLAAPVTTQQRLSKPRNS
ncbi:MAG TPA: HD domain-containing protein [Candidatus Paceibacterota bacterium]